FLVPLPVTRVREHGLVQFQPDSQSHLFVTVDGILQRVHVREGEFVTRGKILAEFVNIEVEKRKLDLDTAIITKRKLMELYGQKRAEARDSTEKNRITQQMLSADAD